MTGSPSIDVLLVVRRSHCVVDPLGTKVHRVASDCVPPWATVLIRFEFSPGPMLAIVLPEKIGSRNMIVSLAVVVGMPSKSAMVVGAPPIVFSMSSKRKRMFPPLFPPVLRMRMCSRTPRLFADDRMPFPPLKLVTESVPKFQVY